MSVRPEEAPAASSHWGWKRYVFGVLSLLAIIAAAALVRSLLYPQKVRRPLEFLPSATKLAVVVDLRPGSPAMSELRQVWSAEDVSRLRERATELSQELVDWTGLKLDLRKDVAPWFAGEAALAMVPVEDNSGLGSRSVVVVARTRSLRQARSALDRAVKPMAHDLEWKRLTAKRAEGTIIVWRDGDRQDHVAYAVRDGCIVISPSLEAVEKCLTAADDPKEGLAETDQFMNSSSDLAKASVVWAYLDTGYVVAGAQRLLPGLRRGWVGMLRQLARWNQGGKSVRLRELGALGVAATPEREGLRLRARYASAEPSPRKPSPTQLAQLARLLPRATAAYALLHQPQRLFSTGRDRSHGAAPRQGGWGAGRALTFSVMAALDSLPNDLLVAALSPRELLIAVPAGEATGPAKLLLGSIATSGASAEIGGDYVVASNAATLDRARRAYAEKEQRLSPPRGRDCQFEIWSRPGLLSPQSAPVHEVLARGWEAGTGGEGEVLLQAEPGKLLGGK